MIHKRFVASSLKNSFAFWLQLTLVGSLWATPWPLGKISPESRIQRNCPKGYSCQTLKVDCPKLTTSIQVEVARGKALKSPRGVIVFFTGGAGRAWWSDNNSHVRKLGEGLRSIGFVVMQVKWSDPGWLVSSPGIDAGTAHLACRPATVIQYIYDREYIPLRLKKITGKAGFAVSGNSGGASQISYALTHYGLADILDVVVPTGGPPHAALSKSCMDRRNHKMLWFPFLTRQFIDKGFGYFNNGPCATHDSTFLPRWKKESCSTGGNDYFYPTTRVHFLIGENDHRMQFVAQEYFKKLRNSNTPFLTWQLIPRTGHGITDTRAGRVAVKKAILGVDR